MVSRALSSPEAAAESLKRSRRLPPGGRDALRFLASERALVSELSQLVKAQPGELKQRVSELLERVKEAERAVSTLRQQQVLARTGRSAV